MPFFLYPEAKRGIHIILNEHWSNRVELSRSSQDMDPSLRFGIKKEG